jgi:hypothetical protein
MSPNINSKLISLIAAVAIASLTLWTWKLDGKSAEDFALDLNTTSVFLKYKGVNIHCSTKINNDLCFQDYSVKNSGERVIINFGNSQQHAINQFKSGDETVAAIIHRENLKKGKWIVTYSQPNANLQEHFLIYAKLSSKYKPSAIVLPIFYDDMRENGVRPDLLNALTDITSARLLTRSEYGKKLLHKYSSNVGRQEDTDGLSGSLQESVESLIDNFLAKHFDIWANRPAIRADLFSLLYKIRNMIFNITPSTIRHEIPTAYNNNWEALSHLLEDAKLNGITVFLYIPPIRHDIPFPYNPTEYNKFKSNIFDLSLRYKIHFMDFDSLVPGPLWGTPDISTGEVDFMHFQGNGHRLLADAINNWIALDCCDNYNRMQTNK